MDNAGDTAKSTASSGAGANAAPVKRKLPEWWPHFEPRWDRKEDFYDVLRVGLVVSLFVQLPNLTLFTVIARLFSPGGLQEAGLEEGAVLLQVVALTAPLCLAAMAFGLLVLYGVISEGFHAALGAALLLAASMWLGSLFAAWGPLEPHTFLPATSVEWTPQIFPTPVGGEAPAVIPDVTPRPTEGSWNPVLRIIESLLGYFVAFGFWPFLHALVVGFFLAWAIGAKIYPSRLWKLQANPTPSTAATITGATAISPSSGVPAPLAASDPAEAPNNRKPAPPLK
jgi:hypothetical protein